MNTSKSLEENTNKLADLDNYLPDTMACDAHQDMDKCPVIKLKQAIVEAVEGLLQDEPRDRKPSLKDEKAFYRNELRAELRQAIKEWQ